jgi:thioredoxin-related protein
MLLAAAMLAAAVVWPALANAAELLMFERAGCPWCERWDREVGTIYTKTETARLLPLRRVNIDQHTPADVALAAPVLFTPTFVVVDNGREVGRITGYINDDAFWGLLDQVVTKLRPRRPDGARS